MGPELQAAINELKTKIAGIETAAGKIGEVDTAVVEDRREFAKTKQEHKDAIDKLRSDLDALPEKVREDFKAHLDSLPNPKKEREDDPGSQWRDMATLKAEDFALDGDRPEHNVFGKGQAFRKSFLSPGEMRTKATIGGAGGSQPSTNFPNTHYMWNQAIVGDPWTAAGAYQMDLDAPNLVTVEAAGINFDTNQSTAIGGASFDTTIGTVTLQNPAAVKTYVCRVLIPNEFEADLMGTVGRIEMMMRLAYGKKRGGLTTAAVVAGIKSGNTRTMPDTTLFPLTPATTAKGARGGIVTTELLALAALGTMPDYWADNPVYVLHAADAVALFEDLADKGGLTIDAVTGSARLGNWPLVVDTQAEANNVKGKIPDFFGAWNSALIQAQRGRLVIDRYMQTIPGAVALYGAFRFVPVAVNNNAYTGIKGK